MNTSASPSVSATGTSVRVGDVLVSSFASSSSAAPGAQDTSLTVSDSSASATASSSVSSSSFSTASPSTTAASTSFSSTLISSSPSLSTASSVAYHAPLESPSAPVSSSGPLASPTPLFSANSASFEFFSSSSTSAASQKSQGGPATTASSSHAALSTVKALQLPLTSLSSPPASQGSTFTSQTDQVGWTTRTLTTTVTAPPSVDWRNAQSASTASGVGSSALSWPSSLASGDASQSSSALDSPTPIAVNADPSVTATQVYTATWQTQTTTRAYSSANPAPAITSANAANAGAAATSGHRTNALVVILVPILLVAALLVLCVIILLHIRRRRGRRFGSTYEDLTRHNAPDIEDQDSLRRPHADARLGESPHPRDMSSLPGLGVVHLDMAQVRGARPGSRVQSARLASPVEDPFADRSPDDTDARPPLFSEYVHVRSSSRGSSTRSPSAASSTRPSSRWGTMSRKGAYSPAPTDLRSGSRSGQSLLARIHPKHAQDGSVDLATPFEWDGMEDPFADPNKHGVD